jgi:Ca2+-binding EF-hand superfamily protein
MNWEWLGTSKSPFSAALCLKGARHQKVETVIHMITALQNRGYGIQDFESMRQNRFKKIDADSDGKLTQDEMKAAAPKDGKGPNVEDIFSQVDTNQDGVIDETEDAAAAEQMRQNAPPPPPNAEEMATDIFKSADSDEDGKISLTDLASALSDKGRGPQLEDLFETADADTDGNITLEDLQTALAKALEQRESQRAQTTQNTEAFYGPDGRSAEASATSSFSTLA